MGFSANKLRVNLKLVINRLKLLEKKKTEIAQKSRKEIADYLTQSKDDRARIRVEHIIREDYLVEAMELLELYADLLLARFGLIETMKYCDEGLCEAVSTLIWAAPRLQSEVNELRVVSDQLGQKYGKQFTQDASANSNKTVNERLIQKLSPKAPPRDLVERYLVEIARSHNVAFEPDPLVMDNDLPDIENSKSFVGGGDDSNFNGSSGFGGSTGGSGNNGGGNIGGGNIGGGNIGGGPGNARGGIGFENFDHRNQQPMSFPEMPSVPGSNTAMAYPPPVVNMAPYPPPSHVSLPPSQPQYPNNSQKVFPGPGYQPSNSQPPPSNTMSPPYQGPNSGSFSPANNNPLPNVPDLPDVPSGSLPGSHSTVGGASGGDDLDFDDLNRRFEELKKKK